MAMKETESRPGDIFGNVDQAIEEYQSQPLTPELVTKIHQTIWQARGELVGATYEVIPCPYTQKELKDLEKKGRRAGYLPVELETQQSRHLLGQMFPQMVNVSFIQSYGEIMQCLISNTPVRNDESRFGWFDYETAVDAPYLNTTEEQLTKKVAKEGKSLLTLNEYIVAGQDGKLFTGQYLDEEGTSARLGSHYGYDYGVRACFYQDGRLFVDRYLLSSNRSPDLGGRSSDRKFFWKHYFVPKSILLENSS